MGESELERKQIQTSLGLSSCNYIPVILNFSGVLVVQVRNMASAIHATSLMLTNKDRNKTWS